MGKIPKLLLSKLLADPLYKKCIRNEWLHDHQCKGRITFEHAIIYAGSQLQEAWAILPLCEYAHSVNKYQDSGILNKDINHWIALNRMTAVDEALYPRMNWQQRRQFLNTKYTKYENSNKGKGVRHSKSNTNVLKVS